MPYFWHEPPLPQARQPRTPPAQHRPQVRKPRREARTVHLEPQPAQTNHQPARRLLPPDRPRRQEDPVTTRLPEPPDHRRRLAAARRRAGYEIGDPTWADIILGAYLDPDASDVILSRDCDEEVS